MDREQINRAVASLRRRGEGVAQAAKEALKEGGDLIVADAKSRVPVRTGALRNSIHYEIKEDGGAIEIKADARNSKGRPYGYMVEYSPKVNRPFLKPAVDANAAQINQMIKAAIEDSAPR